jgi:hypothetical protein
VRRKIARGDRGGLDGTLTSGGERRERPVFGGQRRPELGPASGAAGAAGAPGGGAGNGAGRRPRAQGRRRGAAFIGARGRSPGGGGGHGLPARWAPPGRRGWAGRTGSGLRARPVRIGFFFLFFSEIFSSAYEIPEKIQKIR